MKIITYKVQRSLRYGRDDGVGRSVQKNLEILRQAQDDRRGAKGIWAVRRKTDIAKNEGRPSISPKQKATKSFSEPFGNYYQARKQRVRRCSKGKRIFLVHYSCC